MNRGESRAPWCGAKPTGPGDLEPGSLVDLDPGGLDPGSLVDLDPGGGGGGLDPGGGGGGLEPGDLEPWARGPVADLDQQNQRLTDQEPRIRAAGGRGDGSGLVPRE